VYEYLYLYYVYIKKILNMRERMGRAHCWAAEAMATTEEKALLQRQGGDDGARNAVQKERDDAIRDMASSRVVSEFCWKRGGAIE
jgi:hypothetical protein